VVADFGVAKAIELASSQLDRPERLTGANDRSNGLTMAGAVLGHRRT